MSEQIEKACPFCGGGDCNTEGRTYSNKGQMFCHDCGASGPHPIYEVATWTSRAALAAAQPVVKPLVWEHDKVDDDWTAHTLFESPYYVERAYDADGKDGWMFYMWQSCGYEDVLDSADEAKAAAQADYEARVLAALSLPTQESK